MIKAIKFSILIAIFLHSVAISAIAFSEDFSNPLSEVWTVVDEGNIDAPSAWQVSGGELVQASNIYQNDGSNAAVPKPGTYLRYELGFGWRDVSISWSQRSDDNDALGMMFRYFDNDNYYRFSVDLQRGYRRLVKKTAGVYTLLAEDTVPYVQGVYQSVQSEAVGNRIQVYVDGVLVFDVEDWDHAVGTVAFYCWGNEGAYFDDLLVEDLSEPDDVAPGLVTDLVVVSSRSTSVRLSWTAPGDDGDLGQATSYDVRWSLSPITTDAEFEAANQADGEPRPLVAGSTDEMEVGGLSPSTTYYFALKAVDEAGHVSGLSNWTEGTTQGPSSYMLEEDFFSGLSSDWTVVDEGNIDAPSAWQVSGGELVQASNIYQNDGSNAAVPKPGTYLRYELGFGWRDVSISWSQRSDDNDALGMMFRYFDNDNYYRFSVDLQRGYRRLVKKTAGVYTLLAEDTVPYVQGVYQSVQIEAVGNRIQVYVDGVLVFDVEDWDHAVGTVAFYCWGNEGAYFDDLLVEDLSEPDDVAPGLVTDLVVVSSRSTSVRLSWTAPGDDGDLGQATSYDVRWSLSPITTDAEFEAANQADGEPRPLVAGSTDEMEVGGLSPSTTYYFALKAVDEAGHVSGLSNWTEGTTQGPSSYMLEEDFFSGLSSDWTVVDEGNIDAPSAWQVSGGELVQASNIWLDDGSNAAVPKPGTYLRYELGFGWRDVSISWSQRSDDNDALGMMFRYFDNDNYYRFSVDLQRGYRRLVKKTAGVYTLLAEDTVPYVQGVYQSVQIEAVGNRIQVYVDGVLVFDVEDWDHAVGTVAFYSWGNSGAYFDDLLVEDLSEPDDVAPGLVTDLVVVSSRSTSVRLSWTAPGDDGDLGQATSYDVRWSLSPITTDAEFEAANQADGEPRPLVAGSTDEMEVGGLSPSTTYYFALKAVDEAGHVSGLSNWTEGTTQGPSSYMLEEDFFSGLSSDWTVVDEGNIDAPSAWQVSGGELVQASNIWLDDGSNAAVPKPGTYLRYELGFGWRDVSISWSQRSDDNDALGMMFRYFDNDNYYRFSVDLQRGYRRLVKKTAGVYTLLAEDTVPYVQGVYQSVQIEAVGNRIQVYVDGVLVFDVEDWDHAVGTVAFYCWGNEGAYFDDLLVEDLSGTGPPDYIPPVEVIDLRADSPTANTVRLCWTAPGDDGDLGQATSYDVRWSLSPITTDAEFEAATQISIISETLPAGYEQCYRLMDLPSLSDLYFALKTVDDAGNMSELSNYSHESTFELDYFFEQFDDSSTVGWTLVDEPGSWFGPGDWSITDGKLIQFSGIKGFTTSSLGYPVGTYAIWDGGIGLSNYLIRVEVFSSADGPVDEDRDIGVVFRYQDENNYYRFSMDRARGRRLVAKVDGIFRTLAGDTSAYTLGRIYEIEILASDSKFIVRLDGNTILAAEDFSLSSGSVGFFASYNEGASFDEFLIAALPNEIVLSALKPTSFSVEQADLRVSAMGLDESVIPAVRFTLDPDTAPVIEIDDNAPFEAYFVGAGTGDHDLLVEAYDPAAGSSLSCSRCYQRLVKLGVGGTHLVAFGDSIVRGELDDDQSDDFSADRRNDGIGYIPVLNNWLTSWEGCPQTVIREGFDGFTTTSGFMIIDEIIAKNPGASVWLLLWGTNDVLAVKRSGMGLYPGDSGYSGSYKDYLQRMIDKLQGTGGVVLLGKVPYSSLTWIDDALMQEYNQVIDELYAANGLPGLPPDFYSVFKSDPTRFLSGDKLHPSGEGYRVMARLWYDALADLRPGTLSAPESITVIPVSGGIQIDWPDVAGAEGYFIWRQSDPSALFTRITDLYTGTSYLDESVVSGAAYTYVVTAVNAGVEGPYSKIAATTAP